MFKIYDMKGNATYRDSIEDAEKVVKTWESHHQIWDTVGYGKHTDPAYKCFISECK